MNRAQKINWTIWQTVSLAIGVTLFLLLIIKPKLGLILFWNVLIPVAPLLLVLFPGLWRNICPLSTISMMPKQLKISKEERLTRAATLSLQKIGILLFIVIVPLRHALFNSGAWMTALLLAGFGIVSFYMGYRFEKKSGWCSGMCPVGIIEKVYGKAPLVTTKNARCSDCSACVRICPDSIATTGDRKIKPTETIFSPNNIVLGGLVGFIWGWFQVGDYHPALNLATIFEIYSYPLIGAIASFALFVALKKGFPKHKDKIVSLFSAAAIGCYYWFRIPSLLGYSSVYFDKGTLIDLSESWLESFPISIQLAVMLFFLSYFLLRKPKAWSIRPSKAN